MNRIFVPLTTEEIRTFAKRFCKHCFATGFQTVNNPITKGKFRVVCGCATQFLAQREDVVEHENVICWVRPAPSTVSDAASSLLATYGEDRLRLAMSVEPHRKIESPIGAGFTGAQILAEIERRAGMVPADEATLKPQALES